MKQIYFLLFFVALFIASSAHAKVTYRGKELKAPQVQTIKGYMYDVVHIDTKTEKELREHTLFMPKIVKALIWLDKCHASKKTYELNKHDTDNSFVIKKAIDDIVDIATGKYPNFPVEVALETWFKTGTRAVLVYKEEVVTNPTTKKKETRVVATFKLKPEKKQTKNLVYIYEEEKKETRVKPLGIF